MLGAAIGDALAMPVAGLSHQNVRFFHKGIKGYVADAHRGGAAGTGTAVTERLVAVVRAVRAGDPAALAPDDDPSALPVAVAVPLAALPDGTLGLWLDRLTAYPFARAAARVHVRLLRRLAGTDPAAFDPSAFWASAETEARAADATGRLAGRLGALAGRLHLFPLDLHDEAGHADAPDEAFPFALAMFARNPRLVEPTLLSAINVGGAAPVVGALVGGLIGALHGPEAFPAAWRDGLAVRDALAG